MRLGLDDEDLRDALGPEVCSESDRPEPLKPSAAVLLLGASLVAAFRPFARDLAAQLAPPGSDDQTLEAAAEQLMLDDPELIAERLRVESAAGIEVDPSGFVRLIGPQLPRAGLARCLRARWVSRRAPQLLLGLAHSDRAFAARPPIGVRSILIHDPAGPPRCPSALVCPLTERRLALAGDGAARLIDRNHDSGYRLWAFIEDAVDDGADVLLGADRDALLDAFCAAWF